MEEAQFFDRGLLFHEMSKEYGRTVGYRTFYEWCQILSIDPGSNLYSYDEYLLLLTISWARANKRRNLTREIVKQLTTFYLKEKNNVR